MTAAKPKTLAELRESPDVGLPEDTYELCMSGKLNAELHRIEEELEAAREAEHEAKRGDDKSRGRLGAKSLVLKKSQERDKVRERMRDHSVTVRFRAHRAHEWRKWMNAHPPREDNDLDERLRFNADDLQDAIPNWIVDVGGEPLANGDWQFILDNAAPGDLWAMAGIIRALHESGVEIPKSWTPFLKTSESDDA